MATGYIPLNDLHPASWHQDRALGVGGSEAASLVNEGYGCYRALVMAKRGIEPDYRHTRETELLFKRGNVMENTVSNVFVEETGLKVRRQPSRTSKTHPHARVNMDRQIVAVDPAHLLRLTLDEHGFSPLSSVLLDCGPGALECKTMNSIDFRKVEKEGLTRHNHYILQLQHTMAVTGYKWGIFAILDTTSFKLLWFPMLRNEALCAELLARTEEAWDVVMDTTRPLPEPLAEGDKRCGKCMHRRTCRGEAYLEKFAGADFSSDYVETSDLEIIELANDLITAEEAADQAGEVVKTIKDRIKLRMSADNTTKLKVPDVIRFCISSSAGRKTWDGKAIDGEINAFKKGELPAAAIEAMASAEVEGVAPEIVEQVAPAIAAALLPFIATRLANCQKIGAPSTSFRTFAA